jgi:predicted transcriptional regulator
MRAPLSRLEQTVMSFVWGRPQCTAEECRQFLAESTRPLKESTVRTLLHRLEKKGYVRHRVDGRTYRYRARESRLDVAARSVHQIVERLCGGSVEELMVGMVENEFVDPAELERLAKKIRSQKKEEK